MFIKEVRARAIRDSRNQKTIEVSVNGSKASSPSGKSTGEYETPPYFKSLNYNIELLNSWNENLKINSFKDLKKLEDLIKKKYRFTDAKQFGANALVAFELATLKALAKEKNLELWQLINRKASKFPKPVGNTIGGGLHSLQLKSSPVFQEFLLIPELKTFKDCVAEMNSIYNKIKSFSIKRKNDEGAWLVPGDEIRILSILHENLSNKVRLGTDVASSTFYKNSKYLYKSSAKKHQEHYDFISFLIKTYNLLYIEDPFQEEDFPSFSKLLKENPRSLIVGDDLTATQITRTKKAIKMKSINAMIIKPNQNGSLLELEEIFKLCKKHDIKTVISHRSGETLDDSLADLAFGFQADCIKCGISTKWREAKLNRLIEIELKK